MKIILANKFYYPRGGDCVYTIELEKLLIKNGHNVAIFTQQYDENFENNFSKYWPSKVDYSAKKINNIFEAFIRPIYSKEVKNKFQQLIYDFKPDIVHLNNIHSQISPIIAKIAHKNKIPVVWTLHDYKLLCPSYSCLRNGKVCELCFNKKINVIKHNCVKNIIGSSIAYLEALKWNKKRLEKYTSLFIAPSLFMKQKMVQGGFNSDKIEVLNNFIDEEKIQNIKPEKDNYYLYFGRFSKEKGVETLLKAASKLNYNLKLAGTGPLLSSLKKKYNNDNIEFLGFKQWTDLKKIISKAQFIVIPSEWYENNPLSVIEAFALGTPVIGANIGGIPELICNEKFGLLFESGKEKDLISKIEYFYKSLQYKDLGDNTIKLAKQKFCSSNYYKMIMNYYKKLKKQ